MKTRLVELDYLKGILISLMVLFHLGYVNNTYPYLTKWVYTFHMSGFLIISGFLANTDKPIKVFVKSILKLVVPYILFESFYLTMISALSSIVATSNKLPPLGLWDYLDRICFHPIGTYWYLHTLAICMIAYYLVYQMMKLKNLSALVVLLAILYLMDYFDCTSFSKTVYFLIGVAIFQSKNLLTNIIQPSLWSVIPLIMFSVSENNLDSGRLSGVIITVLVLSTLLFVFNYSRDMIKRLFSYLGRNSLYIVVFSPIFTLPTKYFAPYFSFDSTSVLFGLFSLVFVVGGCLVCIKLMDIFHLSRFIFCKEHCYTNFE